MYSPPYSQSIKLYDSCFFAQYLQITHLLHHCRTVCQYVALGLQAKQSENLIFGCHLLLKDPYCFQSGVSVIFANRLICRLLVMPGFHANQ